ncbi:MAG TPA: cytosine permease [Segeticoccus sp.]|uniref:purine-cytosine permease family protein n=1 Tax=Segeticoccus sp. TaxID=2706531 RepID=UPI002D7F4DA6|nr:cytosine permease [Segeticoccus sp.]HET8600273.1 cytosine permease [Segeticoccus sp.]
MDTSDRPESDVGVAPNPIAAEHYGSRTVAVEPGGVEYIPLSERHGRPIQLLYTWTSPNLEFATIAVGILGVLFWGLTFWQTVAAIALGTALGALTLGIMSTWGPQSGLCQMVLSRAGFGFRGNILPAGINAIVAGIGWFAVNSISGALALHALLGVVPDWLCLLFVVIVQLTLAFFGHNLVQAYERYAFPALVLVFLAGVAVVMTHAHLGAAGRPGGPPTIGGFLLMVGAAYGYAVGWNPYAADYSRYLPGGSSRLAVGWSAALGVFVSCLVLESGGAAMVSAAGKAANVDPGIYTGLMPTWLGDLTLLCIALGAVAANALNIYSGAMSFMAMGFPLRTHWSRATMALVFGVLGFALALSGLQNSGTKYENFLLVIAYWISPWLGVVLTDRVLRRGTGEAPALVRDLGFRNWAGPLAMALGIGISIWLFSNQTEYVGVVPRAHPSVGDLTFEVGFVISVVAYLLLRLVFPERRSATGRGGPPVPAES